MKRYLTLTVFGFVFSAVVCTPCPSDACPRFQEETTEGKTAEGEKPAEQKEDDADKEKKAAPPTLSDLYNETIAYMIEKHGEIAEPTDTQMREFVRELSKRIKRAKKIRVRVTIDDIKDEQELKLSKDNRQVDDTTGKFMFLHQTFKRERGRTVMDRSDQFFKLGGLSKTKIKREIKKKDEIYVDYKPREFKILTGMDIKTWGRKKGQRLPASRGDLYTVRAELEKEKWHVGVTGKMSLPRYVGKVDEVDAEMEEGGDQDASQETSEDKDDKKDDG